MELENELMNKKSLVEQYNEISQKIELSWNNLGLIEEVDVNRFINECNLTASEQSLLASLWARHPQIRFPGCSPSVARLLSNSIPFMSIDGRGVYTVHLVDIFGTGVQGTVFSVASHNAYVKQYKTLDLMKEELDTLQRLVNVPGVTQVLGYCALDQCLLCTFVGKELGCMSLQGQFFTVCYLGFALVDILRAMHDRGIVHRDLSLYNIYVNRNAQNEPIKEVFISDFGCGASLGSAVVYEGTIKTAADKVLCSISKDRLEKIKATRAMDLESLVKTLWMALVACDELLNCNRSCYADVFFEWKSLQTKGPYRVFLNQWLLCARNEDYDGLKRHFSLVPFDSLPEKMETPVKPLPPAVDVSLATKDKSPVMAKLGKLLSKPFTTKSSDESSPSVTTDELINVSNPAYRESSTSTGAVKTPPNFHIAAAVPKTEELPPLKLGGESELAQYYNLRSSSEA